MNPNKFFNKWWLILTKGLLLILLSYFFLMQPHALITSFASIVGFIALLTGAVSIIEYCLTGEEDRTLVEFVSGVFSSLSGFFFLSDNPLAHEWITGFIAIYMTINAVLHLTRSWHLKPEINWWWISIILLLYSFVVDYLITGNSTHLKIQITVFAGIQFLINGILLVVMAFVVRKLQKEYLLTLGQLRNQHLPE